MSVKESIKQAFAQQQAERFAEYRRLVEQAADNISTDGDAAAALLHQLGKSPDDFTADVERIERRRKFAADYQAGQDAHATRERLNREAVKLREAFAPILAAHQAELRSIKNLIDDLSLAILNGNTALVELRKTADPALLDQLSELGNRIDELNQQRQAIMQLAKLNEDKGNHDGATLQRQRIPQIDQDIAALQREQKAIAPLLLEP